ncbi:MAG: hypothetical protein LBK26_02820 [Rickettsiales bacterium]|nr:hypothetical protein [Rickettsiales bacterium]
MADETLAFFLKKAGLDGRSFSPKKRLPAEFGSLAELFQEWYFNTFRMYQMSLSKFLVLEKLSAFLDMDAAKKFLVGDAYFDATLCDFIRLACPYRLGREEIYKLNAEHHFRANKINTPTDFAEKLAASIKPSQKMRDKMIIQRRSRDFDKLLESEKELIRKAGAEYMAARRAEMTPQEKQDSADKKNTSRRRRRKEDSVWRDHENSRVRPEPYIADQNAKKRRKWRNMTESEKREYYDARIARNKRKTRAQKDTRNAKQNEYRSSPDVAARYAEHARKYAIKKKIKNHILPLLAAIAATKGR